MDLAVIFDVDGVLVDSYNAHYESWQLLCGERGLTMTHDQFIATFGRTSREIIKELWRDRATSEATVAELDDRKEALFRELLARDFPALDGAVELIDQLHEAGVPLAVGSSGPPKNVGLVLAALDRGSVFGGVVTGDDVTRGKPDPQVFQLGAERLGAPPSICVVIEDAPVGVAAAHAAGMKCVALVSTGRVREKLGAADLIVDSLRELDLQVLRSLVSS